MSFRQEKKLDITYSSLNKIYLFLSKNKFFKKYPDRKVNSCYFDTINFAMHAQSEEGVVPRKKIRIRWYNDINNTKFYLEKKVTLFDRRFKNSEEISYKKFINFRKIGYFDKKYGFCNPKMMISYNRAYYQNSFFRVTIDTNITYKTLNCISLNKFILDKKPIMEVKYNTEKQNAYDSYFFFKEIRFSKYSRGINFLKNNTYSN